MTDKERVALEELRKELIGQGPELAWVRQRITDILSEWPTAPEPQTAKERELAWVLNRAEEIVRYEHGKDAAYAFEQAWGELPKELQMPVPPAAPEGQTPRFEICHLCKGDEKLFEMEGWAAPDWHDCDTCHGTGKFATLPCGCTMVPPNIIASCYSGHGHLSGQPVAEVR